MLRRLALVWIDVSEEPNASIIKVTRIGELGTTLALTSKPTHAAKKYTACVGLLVSANVVPSSTILLFLCSVRRLLVTLNVVPSSPILVTLMEVLGSPKRRFLQESHGVISQKKTVFIVTIV
jgi:hypothetical protein